MSMHGEGHALAISADGLTHDYGNRPALHGVDLSVAAGEMLALTGPSGSGKSTLVHALSGVLRPDGGQVRVGDHTVTGMSEDERSRLRRTDVGVLFQFGQLVEELTLDENVALPLLLERRPRAEALETARAWLARVGVADLADRLPTQASGGQAQRAALARALVSNPGVLFADEPTGALDSRASEAALELVCDIAAEEGLTVVLITHDARVAAYADREVVLRDGQLEPDESAVRS